MNDSAIPDFERFRIGLFTYISIHWDNIVKSDSLIFKVGLMGGDQERGIGPYRDVIADILNAMFKTDAGSEISADFYLSLFSVAWRLAVEQDEGPESVDDLSWIESIAADYSDTILGERRSIQKNDRMNSILGFGRQFKRLIKFGIMANYVSEKLVESRDAAIARNKRKVFLDVVDDGRWRSFLIPSLYVSLDVNVANATPHETWELALSRTEELDG